MLGTSYAWLMSHSSKRTSKPAYYIVDCRISNQQTDPLHFRRWIEATARDTMQVVENGFGTRVMYEEKGERRAFLWSTEWSSLNYLDRCSSSLASLSLIFSWECWLDVVHF